MKRKDLVVVLLSLSLLPCASAFSQSASDRDATFDSLTGSAAFTERVADMVQKGFTGRVTIGSSEAILYDEVIGDSHHP